MNDDDLYGGYGTAPGSAGSGASGSSMFQPLGATTASPGPPGTSSGRMGTATTARMGTASGQRLGTAAGGADGARPMTSNRGAGFTSGPPRGKFDPLRQGASPLSGGTQGAKKEGGPSLEEQARDMERKVHELLEASCGLCLKGDAQGGLEKASEARKKERALARFRESNSLGDGANAELTYAVDFQLAAAYQANHLYQEALDAYTAIVKGRSVPQAGRLRVNMGNIYFEQAKYPAAIKSYRMALDQLPPAAAHARAAVLRNVGIAFVRMGNYADARTAFEGVMNAAPDHQTAYNLVVCSYALGDKDGMRAAFQALLAVPADSMGADAGSADEDEEDAGAHAGADVGAGGDDGGMKDELRRRRNYIHKCILTAAQLIAERGVASSAAPGGFVAGFDWCSEQLRQKNLTGLAAEVELAKAGRFLAEKDVKGAVAVFKSFEKKETAVRARAATNLSFLYLLEGQLEAATKYTELALKADRYNAKAHVNRGVLLMEGGALDDARSAFTEALAIEPLLPEALYNLGVVCLQLQEPESALVPLKKLHGLLPDSVEVMHQIALAHDMAGDTLGAITWLDNLTTVVPNDPGVLCKLGAIYYKLGEEARSLSYYNDAHRVFPVNLDVISWLGAFHVRNEVYEKALPLFELASRVQPGEAKWGLMVASCYRRVGASAQALRRYKQVHEAHPTNVECLRYLVHLCQELGRADDYSKYIEALRRAERAQATEATAQATIAQQQQQQQQQHQQPAGGYEPSNTSMATGAAKQGVGAAGTGGSAANDDWGNEQLGEDLLPM